MKNHSLVTVSYGTRVSSPFKARKVLAHCLTDDGLKRPIMASQSASKRCRKSNFSVQEMDILTDEVKVHGELLFSSFSSTVTHQEKKKVWRAITDRINASCATNRTPDEIRKKWQDYRSLVKKKACVVRREGQKTGGGPSDLEQKVVSTIPDCQIVGIEAGVDTGLYGEDKVEIKPVIEADEEATVPIEQPVEPTTEIMASIESYTLSEKASPPRSKKLGPQRCTKKASSHTQSTKTDTAKQFLQLKLQKMEMAQRQHEEKIALQHRQTLALESIAESLKSISDKNTEDHTFSLSPLIKF